VASRSHISHLVLSRLGHQHSSAIVEGITGGKRLPREVVQQIANKTDGVPLFVEELTKMVVESGLVREVEGRYELNGPLPPLAIPSTLQDSLMARLDRLGAAKEIAQMGATIGANSPMSYSGPSPPRRGNFAAGAKAISGSGAGVSEWPPTPGAVSL